MTTFGATNRRNTPPNDWKNTMAFLLILRGLSRHNRVPLTVIPNQGAETEHQTFVLNVLPRRDRQFSLSSAENRAHTYTPHWPQMRIKMNAVSAKWTQNRRVTSPLMCRPFHPTKVLCWDRKDHAMRSKTSTNQSLRDEKEHSSEAQWLLAKAEPNDSNSRRRVAHFGSGRRSRTPRETAAAPRKQGGSTCHWKR